MRINLSKDLATWKRKALFFFCCLGFSHFGFAQQPVVHQAEAFTGEMKVYFDSLMRIVPPERAAYFAYTWVDAGVDIWTLHHPWHKSNALIVRSSQTPLRVGEPIALEGTFKWFKKGYERLIAEEHYTKGRPSGLTIQFDKKGRSEVSYDYDKKYNNDSWSLYYEKFNKGKLEKAAFQYFDRTKHHWQMICTTGCYVSKDFR